MTVTNAAKVTGVAVVGVALVAGTAMVSFAKNEEATALTSRTTRVSVSTAGVQADEERYVNSRTAPMVSNGGRFVTFVSTATNLVPEDTNAKADIFVRDMLAGTTTRVSVGAGGVQADRSSIEPSISADGRYVAFESSSTNLVPDDTNGSSDVFVRDLTAGTTIRASVAGDGTQAGGSGLQRLRSTSASISPDGRYVTFVSNAGNLVTNDTNQAEDVFVRDLAARITTRVSVSSGGRQAAAYRFCGSSCIPRISNEGRYVTFASFATNLVPDDTNDSQDIFVRDVVAGTTTRVSVSTRSAQSVPVSTDSGRTNLEPTITSDGRYVFFTSFAENLVPGDTNRTADLFRRDLRTGTTMQIRALNATIAAFGQVSANGRYIGFGSSSNIPDLPDVPGDTNGWPDAYVRDVVTGVTTPVSVSTDGVQGNGSSRDALLSPDGRAAAFQSDATNLVEGDTNEVEDLFLRELNDAEPVGSIAGPTATFAVNATSLFPRQAVTLTQLKLTDGSGVEREVLWGDGSAPQRLATGARTATHAYPAAGRYDVQVVLVDRAGNRTGAAFQGPSTVTVSAPKGTFTLDRSSIFLTQSVSLRPAGVSGTAVVAWGDGATSPVPSGTGKVTHVYARAGSFRVTVTRSNAVGAAAPITVGSVTVAKDTVAPVVTVRAPRNPTVASSWTAFTGTTTDRGLGTRTVRVFAVQKRGAAWFTYTGTSWVKAASETAALQRATRMSVTPDAKGGWRRAVKGVTKGTLKVLYSGTDRAGNTATNRAFTQSVTR